MAKIISLLLVGLAIAGLPAAMAKQTANAPAESRNLEDGQQHIYIIRHGDKYSSYPPCPSLEGKPCYDKELMGDNPPLTECGIKQAEYTAKYLQNQSLSQGRIMNIVVSPFTRALQTALPLAKSLGLKLNMENLVSEARQPDGAFRAFNILAPKPTVSHLEEIESIWNLDYGSPPIPTPENGTLYVQRVKKASRWLKKRFPPSSGNLAIYTHATTSLSMAYGLCYGENGDDAKLKEVVEGANPIGPAGFIHVVLDANGACKKLGKATNVAEDVCNCLTKAHKCEFDDCNSWYWKYADGSGQCLCS